MMTSAESGVMLTLESEISGEDLGESQLKSSPTDEKAFAY